MSLIETCAYDDPLHGTDLAISENGPVENELAVVVSCDATTRTVTLGLKQRGRVPFGTLTGNLVTMAHRFELDHVRPTPGITGPVLLTFATGDERRQNSCIVPSVPTTKSSQPLKFKEQHSRAQEDRRGTCQAPASTLRIAQRILTEATDPVT